jgi:signal transduction histidine kinase/DNA-binding NarL/FixJ family response regulator
METNNSKALSYFFLKGKFTEKMLVNIFSIVMAAFLSIMYDRHVSFVSDLDNYVIVGLVFSFKYIPIMVCTALGGAVPGMMSVLVIFFFKSFISSSFSYLTFIYLIVVCIVDFFSKKRFYNKWYKLAAVILVLQLVVGDVWGVILWLLSGRGIGNLDLVKLVFYFLNEFPGCFIATVIIYLLLRFLPVRKKLLFENAKYYTDPKFLDGDDRYALEGRSKIGRVVMHIIIFEALILGISAEVASNTLVPTIKYVYSTKDTLITIEEDWDGIYNTENLEDRVSFRLERDSINSAQLEQTYSLNTGFRDTQFSVKLAMLIAIIVIPLAVFVNRYAQHRIVDPIQILAKSVSNIYNSNDLQINEKVAEVHELDIKTRDEIEDLYHAVDLTFYRLMEYIDLVKTRQSIEDQLKIEKSANEAKSRFLSNISHEIRTPINAVLGFDEMIIRESKDETILGYAKDIQGSGKTLLALINDVLDFSKIEAGKLEIIPVEYELGSAINDIVSMAAMKAREKDLEMLVNVNPNIPHILYGDEIRIKQCILNILTNAVKYTEKGKVILDIDYAEYELDEPEDENVFEEDDNVIIKVKVTDTGIGIKEEDIDKLTSAFERIDEKRNRTIEGTGLGINIVVSLLSMMSSKLNVKSEYGEGSEFSFDVVQRVVDPEPVGDFNSKFRNASAERADYKEAFHAPEAKILVVDDTKTNITVVQGLLKQTRIQIDTALSGMVALGLVKKNKYDIIFLDHRMPEMDGIQTFHAMREMTDNLSIDAPVIALTANAISGSREMYYKEGFSNYLSKPVDPGKLEDIILQYLPEDKVVRPGDKDFVSNSEEEDELEKEAMQELLSLSGVDIEFAIERCGSAEAAVNVMKDFRMAIDERSGLIEKYEKNGDIANYTIYVHGLKSSAKAVGAIELSEKAEYLEKCGNENDVEKIREMTPELLELYRSYLDKLEILTKADDEGKPLIDPSELEGAYASMKEFISGSFFDSADDIMKMLDEYRIPDEMRQKHEEVKRLMAAVDRDGLLNIL